MQFRDWKTLQEHFPTMTNSGKKERTYNKKCLKLYAPLNERKSKKDFEYTFAYTLS